jgi:hypothetical protein
MKRNLIGTSSLVVLSLLLTFKGALAQSREGGSVPFAFQVSGEQLPAGNYSVTKQTGSNFITIQNLKTSSSVMVLGRPELSGNKSRKLVFHHAGGQYFLSQIWGAEGTPGMLVPASKLEKEFEIARVTPKASNNVEIALK